MNSFVIVCILFGIVMVSGAPQTRQDENNISNRKSKPDEKVKPLLSLEEEWNNFKVRHSKKYDLREESFRKTVFAKNLRKVEVHNKDFAKGRYTYSLGINEYADLTSDEYSRYLLGARPPKTPRNGTNVFKMDKWRALPSEMDWRQQGYVSPIKNQGQCGSCWAFSSTGALEAMHYQRTGQRVELSEQNLVDCTLSYGNGGCNGGWMNTAFRYVIENGGIDYEQSYPYVAKTEKKCFYNNYYSGTTCAAYADIAYGSEEDLKGAVASVGPVAVAIDAAHSSFQLYKSGVYYEPKCNSTTSDHAVLVVGYGTYNGSDYWLVKNSWGTSWGMDGYIMMARNEANNCAIASFASFPIEY